MNFCNHTHPLVDELVVKLRTDSHDGDDVSFVIAAFNWVRDEIKYVILTDWTVPVEFTLETREGNCGTKACLLYAILRAGGIKEEDIGFGLQRIATADTFFFVPKWVSAHCSKRSIHFSLAVRLKGKWIHLDTSLDMELVNALRQSNGDCYDSIFDGENHAVMGGYEGFDPNEITVVPNIDGFMQKTSRIPAALRQCFNFGFEYIRHYGSNFSSKDELARQVEEYLLSRHRPICQEVFYFLMRQQMSKL
jgi:transglutaminase-like putative cysteine protease